MDIRTLELLAFIKEHNFIKIKSTLLLAANSNGMSSGESMKLENSNCKQDVLYTFYKMLDELNSNNPNNREVATQVVSSFGNNLAFIFNNEDAKKLLSIFDNYKTFNVLFSLDN